jgi:hypothetical protein
MSKILMLLMLVGLYRSPLLLRQHFGIVPVWMLTSMIRQQADVLIVLMLTLLRGNSQLTHLGVHSQLAHVLRVQLPVLQSDHQVLMCRVQWIVLLS